MNSNKKTVLGCWKKGKQEEYPVSTGKKGKEGTEEAYLYIREI
jgi:hypothetical protein